MKDNENSMKNSLKMEVTARMIRIVLMRFMRQHTELSSKAMMTKILKNDKNNHKKNNCVSVSFFCHLFLTLCIIQYSC